MAVGIGPSLGFLGGGTDVILIDKDTPLANSATLTVLDGVMVASGSRLAAKSIGSGVYAFGLVRTGGGSAIENIEAGIRVGGTASTVRGINNFASTTAAIVANIRTGGGSMEFVARAWASSINLSAGWMMHLARWGAMPLQIVGNTTATPNLGTSPSQLWVGAPMESAAVISPDSGILTTAATPTTVVAAVVAQYADRTVSVDIQRNGTSVATSSGGRRAYSARWTGTPSDHDEFKAFGSLSSLSSLMQVGSKMVAIAHTGKPVGTSSFTLGSSSAVSSGGDAIFTFTRSSDQPTLHTGAQAIITGAGTATVTGKLTRSSATPTNQVDLLLNGTAIATQTWGASDSSEKTFSWTGSLTYGDILEFRSTWTGSGTQTFTSGQLTITETP